jgi:hypothetical protein
MLTLLIIEGVFRLAGIRGEYHEPRIDKFLPDPRTPRKRWPFGLPPYATLRSIYDSNPRGYFAAGNVVDHKLNSLGWRDEEHEEEKPPGTYRILGLGDSYLFGQGVRREDICLSKLGRVLTEALPGKPIETINTGVSAMNTANERRLLERHGLKYEPDLVIVHFVLNDVEKDLFGEGPKVEFFQDYTSIYQTPDTLSEYSYLWSWVRQRYLQHKRGREYIKECLESFTSDSAKWRLSSTALDDIQALCRRNGIALLVVIFPFYVGLDGDYPFQPIHDTIRNHCLARSIHVLDLSEHYASFNGPELWVHPTDQHPNEIAHEIAAEAMAEYILDRRVEFSVPGERRVPPKRSPIGGELNR